MFKKKKIRTGVLLFISSYTPLLVIIIIQNLNKIIQGIFDSEANGIIEISHEITSKSYSLIVLLCLLVGCSVLITMKFMIKNMNTPNGDFVVEIRDIQNKNHEYVTGYIAALILPFITLDLTSIAGLIQLIFLGLLIGYIYISNEMYYINPVLNLIFKYKIYNVKMVYTSDGIETSYEAILLSKANKGDLLKKKISVYKANSDFFIEKN